MGAPTLSRRFVEEPCLRQEGHEICGLYSSVGRSWRCRRRSPQMNADHRSQSTPAATERTEPRIARNRDLWRHSSAVSPTSRRAYKWARPTHTRRPPRPARRPNRVPSVMAGRCAAELRVAVAISRSGNLRVAVRGLRISVVIGPVSPQESCLRVPDPPADGRVTNEGNLPL